MGPKAPAAMTEPGADGSAPLDPAAVFALLDDFQLEASMP